MTRRKIPQLLIASLLVATFSAPIVGGAGTTSESDQWGGVTQTWTFRWDSTSCSGAAMYKPRYVSGKWTRSDTTWNVKSARLQMNAWGQPCGGLIVNNGKTVNIGIPSYGVTYGQAGSSSWPFVSGVTGVSVGAFVRAKVYRGLNFHSNTCHEKWFDSYDGGCAW